jgi:hypothetical protein
MRCSRRLLCRRHSKQETAAKRTAALLNLAESFGDYRGPNSRRNVAVLALVRPSLYPSVIPNRAILLIWQIQPSVARMLLQRSLRRRVGTSGQALHDAGQMRWVAARWPSPLPRKAEPEARDIQGCEGGGPEVVGSVPQCG